MLSKLRTLLHTLEKPDQPIRVLTFPTHEAYQTNLGYIPNVEWYLYHPGGGKQQWDFATKPLPKNTYLHVNGNISGDVVYDCVLSQEPISQFPVADNIRQTFGIPLYQLYHTEPYPNMTQKRLNLIKSFKADKTAFITKHNQQSWGYDDTNSVVIPHGIDTNVFCPNSSTQRNKHGVSVVNHLMNRGQFYGIDMWKNIAAKIPMRLIGENPQISTSISDSGELAQAINSSAFFLNTSIYSPCPLSLLEAASCGIGIVSTNYQEIGKIFTHEKDALLSNDPDVLLSYCQKLLDDPEYAIYLGNNARNTIIENFGISKFITNWTHFLTNG